MNLLLLLIGYLPVIGLLIFLYLRYRRKKDPLPEEAASAKEYPRQERPIPNADRILGKTCIVTQRIDNVAGTGAVRVDGQTWTARTKNGETVDPDSLVVAESIQGVKLLVSPVQNNIS